ncbi:unnamed protein product, partial [Staurois parvus]
MSCQSAAALKACKSMHIAPLMTEYGPLSLLGSQPKAMIRIQV